MEIILCLHNIKCRIIRQLQLIIKATKIKIKIITIKVIIYFLILIFFIIIERHRRSKHEQQGRDFACDCGKSFLSQPALNNHIKNKHPERLEGQIKRGRGRPRKYPPKPQLDFESTKYESFFDLPHRKAEEGICLNIQQLVETCFNSIYLGSYANKLFSKPKSYKENYILNSLANNEKVTEKPRGQRNCDEVFYEYLSIFKSQANDKYFLLIMKFIILFRECYDVSKNKNIVDEKKEQITNKLTPEGLPDLCNEFYGEFLEPNNFFGIEDQNDRVEIIDIIQHFCIWLFKNDYTKSKLSLASG